MADRELLLLDSNNPIVTAEANKWCSIDNAAVVNFIKDIITSIGSANEQQDKFRAIISGVPSPWARVLLTRKAVLVPKTELKDTVLDECYKLLKSEWRGLVAAYALYPDSFEFSEPIPLTGTSVSENNGDMSVRYIYGQMLFDQTPLWVHKNEAVESKDNPPCIQILYYKKNEDGGFKLIPVAATSPYTFLFSSVNYNLLVAQKEIPWIGNDGKFKDPLEKIELNDMQRLYSFLTMISTNMYCTDKVEPNKFYRDWIFSVCKDKNGKESLAKEVKTNIEGWAAELGQWKTELGAKISSKKEEPNPNIPLIYNTKPVGPLAMLLNSDHKFYFSDGVLSTNKNSNESVNEILSSNIFIDSDYIAAWDNNTDNGKDYSKSAAYYLITEDRKYALPLPFTKDALGVFENNIESIVFNESESYVRLCAKVIVDGRVEVELRARLDKSVMEIPICKKAYQLSVVPETEGKVFVWPNFYAEKWNKYFYYSEFPSNVSGVKMLPCFENLDFTEDNKDNEEVFKQHFVVRYPLDRVAASSHKYEIIKTDKPLKYIVIRLNKSGSEIDGGILLLKRSQDENEKNKMRVIRGGLESLKDAVVGIDFGSTNTCAYYKKLGEVDPIPVPFSNRRLALVGFDAQHGDLAGKDELLFISNEGTAFENGQVKSWLHLHDPLYLALNNDGSISNLYEELVGGVPVNESNLSVKSMNEQTIQTNAGELRYNMKWYSEEENRKTAFMRMLWIHICADMLASGCKPKELYWSFPSSMTNADRTILGNIYTNAVNNTRPLIELNKIGYYTEAEAVCAYSISDGTEVDSSTLSLGIDVGGSTSDILIVGSKDNADTLLTQSSVRMAGGFFFKAINSSAKFRRSLFNFHQSHITNIDIKNIDDVVSSDPEIYSRAPYYLNSIFDQLNTDTDFYNFYDFIRREVSQVFAYPAYVTGVLMFYSGMLVKNVVRKNNMENLHEINMRYYGKGGRLFEWLLDMYSDAGERYYKKCFKAGFESDFNDKFTVNISKTESKEKVNIEIKKQVKKENKSEVARGLVSGLFGNIASGKVDEDEQRIIEHYDVIGEKGIKCTKMDRVLDGFEVIPDVLFDGGVNMEMPDKFENFSKFIDIFTQFLFDNLILKDVSALEKGKDHLKIRAFIQTDPEFNKCLNDKSDKRPVYRMPVFIAEALCYLNDVLLPEVSNQLK